jgi:N-acetylneuraminate synthase
MKNYIKIGNHLIGRGLRTYCIAELSANHNQNFKDAVSLIHAAKKAGADAIKLQTYTPDTLTINCDNDFFRLGKGTLWEGKNLYELYKEAYTPWEWQPALKKIANDLGMDLFSTPFDRSAVDFLETMDVPAYKIASFELIDLPLIEYVAETKKPIILSTGMASQQEIHEAVDTIRSTGNKMIALLKCTSAYPASEDEMNIRTIPDLIKKFKVPIGLSDHTKGCIAPIVAVSIGACIVEKHFTFSRETLGPDSAFSMEPHEFKEMVHAIRTTEATLGKIHYGPMKHERQSLLFRRSLFAVENIKKGEIITEKNVRSIRPGQGLPPKFLKIILGKKVKNEIKKGTPLSFDLIDS